MSSDTVAIEKHIRRTNNTLILGVINSNAEKGIPSLTNAIMGAENWGTVIEEIYGEDDKRRLVVESIDDVTRVFQPTYYFKVGEESVDGVLRKVVHHSLRDDGASLPVQITRESLCYKILDRKGRVQLSEILEDLRKNLDKARNHYVTAARTNSPKLLREQEDLRRNFVSRLTEPVITYLIAAESCRDYTTIKASDVRSETEDGKHIRRVKIFIPDRESLTLKEDYLEIWDETEDIITEEEEDWEVVAGAALEAPIRQGQRLLAAAINGQLKGADNESTLPEVKQKLLKALTATGVGSELMIDHIKLGADAHGLMTTSSQNLLSENPNLKLLTDGEDAKEGEETKVAKVEKGKAKDAAAESSSGALVLSKEVAERREQMLMTKQTKEQAEHLRDKLQSEELLRHVKRIESAAIQYHKGDKEKQKLVKIYTHTLTPVGRIENKMEGIRQSLGEQPLRGKQGFDLYLQICLEEARERSDLVEHFEEWIVRALLKQPYEIKEENENRWIAFHDQIMNAAQQTFIDYMAKVSPIVAHLKGISTFLKATGQTKHRVPRVLVANISEEDLLTDEDIFGKFKEFIHALNDVNQEEFERAISIVIAPRLDLEYADDLFRTGFEEGFSVFFSPEEIIGFNELNDRKVVDGLKDNWAASETRQMHYLSGVLCVPDTVLLPKGYRFKLGEFLASQKTCQYVTKKAVAVRGSFNAAGIVARNDDTHYVEGALRGIRPKLKLEKKWPSLGLRFEDPRTEPLYITDYLSEGVILKSNLNENLPFCLFEHSTDKGGRLKNQRMRFLNTLFILGDRPVPLYEYRAAQYLKRAIALNHPDGTVEDKLMYFAEDSYEGIYREGIDNSILDKDRYKMTYEDRALSIKNIAEDLVVTGISVDIVDKETAT